MTPVDVDPQKLFRTIGATSRPAGSDAEARARSACETFLAGHGFQCRHHHFTYSAWPGRWATPVCGALLFLGAAFIVVRSLANGENPDVIARALSFGMLGLASAIGVGLVTAWFGTTAFPWARSTSTNLEAVRGASLPNGPLSSMPRIWLVAHLDSKSQPIPMSVRVAAIGISAITWAGLLGLWCVVQFVSANTAITTLTPIVLIFASVAMIAALPIAACTILHKGTGALDNASGVAAVLSAVGRIDPTTPLGVLITSAEELGLAGARAWARERLGPERMRQWGHIPTSQNHSIQHSRHEGSSSISQTSPNDSDHRPIFLNCDSVDDRGTLTCMFPRRHAYFFHKPIDAAQKATKNPIISRRLVPGILVDAVVFSKAECLALTVSRGDWLTLARIHSHRDTLAQMTGVGIESAAQCLATLVAAIATNERAQVR